jgi:RimJ/RimL family protein N-acetyltransferase
MILSGSLQFIYGDENCTFRTIYPEDVTQDYIDGLSKEKKYLSNIPSNVSIESQQRYISHIIDSSQDTICGLFLDEVLVGTAGLQNLVPGKYATIGIFLFSTAVRGKGLGKVLVWAASKLALKEIQIAGTLGGVEPDNIPSVKSFLACGGVDKFDKERNIHQFYISVSNLETPTGITNLVYLK